MHLNNYQRALVRTYGVGDGAKGKFSWIGQIADEATLKAAIDNTDDLVFQDIMAGLGSPECDSNEKACEIIRNARPNVQRLYDHEYAFAPGMAG